MKRKKNGVRGSWFGVRENACDGSRVTDHDDHLPFLLMAVLVLLSCDVSFAQTGTARPFASLRRDCYRVASGPVQVETVVPAWDSRGLLGLAPDARLWRLRSFEADGKAYALCVDVETLKTCVMRGEDVKSVEEEIPEVCQLGEGGQGSGGAGETAYWRALRRYARTPMVGEGKTGLVLTVDLCPSRRRWDRDLFDALREMASGEKPLPVAVCVSGGWVRHHGEAFGLLLTWHREGALDLTFVNHSDTHPVGGRGDFLNNDGVNFEAEVLNAEVTLLSRGAVPSVFFRFPGLVHTTARLEELRRFGLIPVDADHWPGRDHAVVDRVPEGILLVHGNGNERAGVDWFFEMVRRTGMKEKLREGTRRALSLADCAIDE